MNVHFGVDQLPQFRKAVITTGTFDGVHFGHQQLLHRIKRMANEVNGESVIITFQPHPRLVIQPYDQNLKLLSSLNEKINSIADQGIDHVVVVPFTINFAQMEAMEYLQNFIVQKFHPAIIVLGYNHQFGHHRDGNLVLLEKHAADFGYSVSEIEFSKTSSGRCASHQGFFIALALSGSLRVKIVPSKSNIFTIFDPPPSSASLIAKRRKPSSNIFVSRIELAIILFSLAFFVKVITNN